MGFQVVVTFIASFMDDIDYVRNVEICMQSMIYYTAGFICYGSENFGLRSLHDDYVGLAGATTQLYSVATYRSITALQMSNLFSIDRWDFFPINQLIALVFKPICYLFLAMCSFQFNMQSKCSPTYFTSMSNMLLGTTALYKARTAGLMCE